MEQWHNFSFQKKKKFENKNIFFVKFFTSVKSCVLTFVIFSKKKDFYEVTDENANFPGVLFLVPGQLRHSNPLCWIPTPIVGISKKNWPGFPLTREYCPVQSAIAEFNISLFCIF